eukprot:TRINITY_DN10325_c0_g1_i1.p1 TRINITY_DN10325_c0_g1~~TRINITY_DN10325_c0_g1_i1.p1  ORF type:complete len:896 (+),score=307.61 TRINITY_DN10325_c0_g1_i1:125-2812(+)
MGPMRDEVVAYVKHHDLYSVMNDLLGPVLEELPADPLMRMYEILEKKLGLACDVKPSSRAGSRSSGERAPQLPPLQLNAHLLGDQQSPLGRHSLSIKKLSVVSNCSPRAGGGGGLETHRSMKSIKSFKGDDANKLASVRSFKSLRLAPGVSTGVGNAAGQVVPQKNRTISFADDDLMPGQRSRGGSAPEVVIRRDTLCTEGGSVEDVQEEFLYLLGRDAGITINIVHFNDVYHTKSGTKEPVGGASRFATAIAEYRDQQDAHVLFSGDAFSPSLDATITQGAHMVPLLNAFKLEAACVGNHDLDFGLDRFADLATMCEFPWLLTNLKDQGEQLRKTEPYRIFEWDDVRVGVMAIVEKAWLDACGQLPDTVHYEDMIVSAQNTCDMLKLEGCHLIIAMTHMQLENDELLAEKVPDIDLILGGHDHIYAHHVINDTHVVKSGSDFKQFSMVKVTVPAVRLAQGHDSQFRPDISIKKVNVTSDFAQDEAIEQVLEDSAKGMRERLKRTIAVTEVPLDLRFCMVRTTEIPFCNLVCDVVRWHYHFANCDFALLQGGCFRADREFDPGELSLEDIFTILPMEDPLVLIELTGEQVWKALEGGVAKYPALDGRFPQVSGLSFKFDPAKKPGSRITAVSRLVNGERVPMELEATYRLATSHYLSLGNDGYDVFSGRERVIDCEQGILLPMVLRNYLYLQRCGDMLGYNMNAIHRVRSEAGPQGLAQLLRKHLLDRPLPGLGQSTQGLLAPVVEGRIRLQGQKVKQGRKLRVYSHQRDSASNSRQGSPTGSPRSGALFSPMSTPLMKSPQGCWTLDMDGTQSTVLNTDSPPSSAEDSPRSPLRSHANSPAPSTLPNVPLGKGQGQVTSPADEEVNMELGKGENAFSFCVSPPNKPSVNPHRPK